jgi:hypothetical protein
MKGIKTFELYWNQCILIDRWLKEKANSKKKAAKIEIIKKGNDQKLRQQNKWLNVSYIYQLL